jgi:hypothetical protein
MNGKVGFPSPEPTLPQLYLKKLGTISIANCNNGVSYQDELFPEGPHPV